MHCHRNSVLMRLRQPALLRFMDCPVRSHKMNATDVDSVERSEFSLSFAIRAFVNQSHREPTQKTIHVFDENGWSTTTSAQIHAKRGFGD